MPKDVDPLPTPAIPKEIVEYLTQLFPDKTPDLKDTDREVWYKAGQAFVVRKLRSEYELQSEDRLGGKT